MAVSRRPSYLKRQKEQKRLAKAAEKREARLARKHSPKGVEIEGPEALDELMGDTWERETQEDGDTAQ